MEKTFDESNLNKKLMVILLCFYLYFLIWFLFFRCSVPEIFYRMYPFIKGYREPTFYIVPFYSFFESYEYKTSSLYYYMISFINLIIAIPSSVGLQTLFRKRKKLYTFIITLFVSIVFELLQHVTRFGLFDIDDIFLYLIGTGIGFIIYDRARKKLSDQMINKVGIYLLQSALVVFIYSFVMIITQLIVLFC